LARVDNTVKQQEEPMSKTHIHPERPDFKGIVQGARTTVGGRAFAIADLENQIIFGGQRLGARLALDVVEEIARQVSGMPVRAALTEPALRSYVPLLAGRGWGIDCVDIGPDAADWVLIGHSIDAYLQGYDELHVVSGDAIFAQFAEFMPIHVISHPDRLSRELVSVASIVTHLHSGRQSHVAA
jgi:hypothetical protein